MSCPKLLEHAIEGLYAAFAAYPLPEDTMPCDGCHTHVANDLLHAAPLRELQWEHLADYSTDALLVWGDLNCYKHFLPRIFELLLTASDWRKHTPTPEMVFLRFTYGEWRSWPDAEQAAVRTMLDAIWETILSNPPLGLYIDVEQWLCCISQCEADLGPYLDRWMNDERLSSAWALSSLILGSTIAYTGKEHEPPVWDGEESRERIQEWFNQPQRGAFWKGCDTQYAQLQRWARSPAALDKLNRAEIDCGQREMAREFRAAQRCIREAKTTKFQIVYAERRFQTSYWESPTYRLY
jgi:hypothetical protein